MRQAKLTFPASSLRNWRPDALQSLTLTDSQRVLAPRSRTKHVSSSSPKCKMTRMRAEGPTSWVGQKPHCWDYADGPALSGHYLGGVTVRPDFRRLGVASELTGARMAWIWERADHAWYVVNALNEASLALHRRWGFREVARGPGFHTVTFDGGEGVLLQAARPLS